MILMVFPAGFVVESDLDVTVPLMFNCSPTRISILPCRASSRIVPATIIRLLTLIVIFPGVALMVPADRMVRLKKWNVPFKNFVEVMMQVAFSLPVSHG